MSIGDLLKRATVSHQAGNLVLAEGLYRQVLEQEPEHPDALHLLGLAAYQQGRSREADDLISRAIRKDASRAYFHNNLGEVRRAEGDVKAAEGCYREAVRMEPGYAQAHNNLGLTLHALGRLDEAEAAFNRALELEPTSAPVHNNLGITQQGLGRLDGAIASFRRSIELDPGHAEARNNLGAALRLKGNLDEAATVLQQAIQMHPELARPHYNLASVRVDQGDLETAEKCSRKALELSPNEADFHYNLGHILRLQGDFDAATQAMEKAVLMDPGHAIALNDLGVIGLLQGRFDEAAGFFRRAIAAAPGLAIACENLSKTRRFTAGDGEDIDLLQSRLDSGELDDSALVHLHFAIGKIRDDLAEYDAAFAHIHKANALKRASVKYDAADQARFVDESIDLFDAGFMQRLNALSNPSELPVLIIGVPRSGTSLVEQILASHPQVHGAGELDYFKEAARVLPDRLEDPRRYPLCLDGIEAAIAGELAQGYLNTLQREAGDALRVTDKMPLNFEHLGLIAGLFPKARIIHCRRNPLDLGVSLYFQHFARDNPYAYDLADIIGYYQHYQRLMAHWRELLPGRIFELDYEQLVASTEEHSRALLAHCGLEWDERCLRHYETKRMVGTASHWQVRQPVYSSAVGRWKHYRQHLGPLIAAFGEDGSATR